MTDSKLMPMPEEFANWLRRLGVERGPSYYKIITGWVEAYARANVEHHTEKLRAEVDNLTQANAALTQLWLSAGAELNHAETRVERLEEVLRQVQQKLEGAAMIRGGHGTFAGTYLLVMLTLDDQQGGES